MNYKILYFFLIVFLSSCSSNYDVPIIDQLKNITPRDLVNFFVGIFLIYITFPIIEKISDKYGTQIKKIFIYLFYIIVFIVLVKFF